MQIKCLINGTINAALPRVAAAVTLRTAAIFEYFNVD
jgi:hypothetical protein